MRRKFQNVEYFDSTLVIDSISLDVKHHNRLKRKMVEVYIHDSISFARVLPCFSSRRQVLFGFLHLLCRSLQYLTFSNSESEIDHFKSNKTGNSLDLFSMIGQNKQLLHHQFYSRTNIIALISKSKLVQ